jgi:redox-sensing transcriptional repressor
MNKKHDTPVRSGLRPAVCKNEVVRLSQYRAALRRFKELGFSKIYSNFLGEAVGVTSAQVRKDFSHFKISGNKRGGYAIDEVMRAMDGLFRKERTQKVVLVGAGNIGKALLNYRGFQKENITIVAAFDIDPAKCSRTGACPVLPVTALKEYVQEHEVQIGILAVPEITAQQLLDQMVDAGIKGVMNFAPCNLRYPEDRVTIANVNLVQELEYLAFAVDQGRKTG